MRSHHTLSILFPLTMAAAACSDLPTPTSPLAEPVQSHSAGAACVNFEPPLAAGTIWGFSAGQPPLTYVHAESGIRVFTEKFYLTGGGTAYRDARIGLPPVAFSAGQAARTLHQPDLRLYRRALRPQLVHVRLPGPVREPGV